MIYYIDALETEDPSALLITKRDKPGAVYGTCEVQADGEDSSVVRWCKRHFPNCIRVEREAPGEYKITTVVP